MKAPRITFRAMRSTWNFGLGFEFSYIKSTDSLDELLGLDEMPWQFGIRLNLILCWVGLAIDGPEPKQP